jgi:F-type H+-transporting ATPase subunit b
VGALQSLGIDPSVALAQSISLLILIGVLWGVLYKPFQALVRQREETVANHLANAEAQSIRAQSIRKEYEDNLAHVADEARQRLDQATKDAEAARQRMLDTAQAEIHDLYARHEAQLALEREQLRRELRKEMSAIAVLAAEKALRAKMTPELQSAINDQVLSELDQTPYH